MDGDKIVEVYEHPEAIASIGSPSFSQPYLYAGDFNRQDIFYNNYASSVNIELVTKV